jgi:RecA-family ATPase
VDQQPGSARVVDQPDQMAPFLDADDSGDGGVGNRFERFFALQEANFIIRRANIMTRFQENRRLRLDDDSEDNLEKEADEDREVPIKEFPEWTSAHSSDGKKQLKKIKNDGYLN